MFVGVFVGVEVWAGRWLMDEGDVVIGSSGIFDWMPLRSVSRVLFFADWKRV